MLKLVQGNLLKGNYQYIAHQTNCIPGIMGGLAGQIVRKYPKADTRFGACVPGQIDVIKPVINMYAQDGLGVVPYKTKGESGYKRLVWFRECLIKITKIDDLQQIAFPYLIGCGLAGGNWLHYEKLLIGFADYMFNKYATEVYLVKL